MSEELHLLPRNSIDRHPCMPVCMAMAGNRCCYQNLFCCLGLLCAYHKEMRNSQCEGLPSLLQELQLQPPSWVWRHLICPLLLRWRRGSHLGRCTMNNDYLWSFLHQFFFQPSIHLMLDTPYSLNYCTSTYMQTVQYFQLCIILYL